MHAYTGCTNANTGTSACTTQNTNTNTNTNANTNLTQLDALKNQVDNYRSANQGRFPDFSRIGFAVDASDLAKLLKASPPVPSERPDSPSSRASARTRAAYAKEMEGYYWFCCKCIIQDVLSIRISL